MPETLTFSPTERLILLMLADICEHLKTQEYHLAKLVADAVNTGNHWMVAASSQNPSNEITPWDTAEEVSRILQLWTLIERNSNHVFPGFDGNEEVEHVSAARAWIEGLKRFEVFQGRFDHGVARLDDYREMMARYIAMFNGKPQMGLTADHIEEILGR